MINMLRLRQIWIIARLQLRRVFFARRSLWIFFLALFPSIIFLGHGIKVKIDTRFMSSHITSASVLEAVSNGDLELDIIKKAGNPVRDNKFNMGPKKTPMRKMTYFDGKRQWNLFFRDGVLHNKRSREILNFNEDRLVYATMFQVYYLRIAIFFGCLGIFMNLFRGEMMDKTLHFWFLAPAKREVLLTGKYLSGIIAAVSIFTVGAVISFLVMLWPHHTSEVTAFWQGQGLSHLFSYASAAALACIGYGSIFLAFGLILKNPVLPAVIILFWESINGVLPSLLQKLSVLHYAQSLCPVSVPVDSSMPILFRLLISPANPPSIFAAVSGFVVVTALVLWVASRIVRHLEINYNTE